MAAGKRRADLNKLDEKERAELLNLMEDQRAHTLILLHSVPRPSNRPQPEIDPKTKCFILRITSI
jgi:flagellar motility protein MotE (MotC chaperone)